MNKADEISQTERRRVMENDRKVATYHFVAQSAVDDERGGRYAVEGKATVTGSSPISYPAQPTHSPWHHDPIGTEPPLGYSIDAIDPVGEVFERGPPSAAAAPEVEGDGDGSTTDTGRPVIRKGLRRI